MPSTGTPFSDFSRKSQSPPPVTAAAPIPPPRPKETFTNSTVTSSKFHAPLIKHASNFEFGTVAEEVDERDSLTPPPIPSRDADLKKTSFEK